MPIIPESYDRSPLTDEEKWALAHCSKVQGPGSGSVNAGSRASIEARRILARFNQPIDDLFCLRHQGHSAKLVGYVQHIMRCEMHRHGKMFWDWSAQEWIDTLCPTPALFDAKYGRRLCAHMTVMDAAYLLGGVSDLRPVGIEQQVTEAANTYFGTQLVLQRYHQVLDILRSKGYADGWTSAARIRQCLSMLFVLQRSPYLEDITEVLLADVAADNHIMRQSCGKVALALQHLGLLSSEAVEPGVLYRDFDHEEMAREWYLWCMAWYDREVDLAPRVRQYYAGRILAVGRWLSKHAPDVHTPEQWTEDLALHFRADLCSWRNGQYGSERGRLLMGSKERLDRPMSARSIAHYLIVLRRYFTDLARRPYAVGGVKPRKITLDFNPKEILTLPDHLKRAVDAVDPRDIDLRVWAKLTLAAATLSQSDLPSSTRYPLSFYRALALVWVTSARRPNEIARLRLDCLREEWDASMLDEDDQPVERIVHIGTDRGQAQEEGEREYPKIFYLHVPSGKNRGSFWIWLPDYVAHAINSWKRERPPNQRKLFDRKDRAYVDYLFCYRDTRVGSQFINRVLIPALCAKAGVEVSDATGRITGHRGRSTRLTLLRSKGVSLDDLAEYAGHADNRTIRRYARQNPLQLHRIIKAADDVSRILEGVVDMQAAAQGFPALRWFIGYDADGEPMYCANQLFVTCPHRLDCERCGMFIGGEKARLLQEGENTLPITSKVPMTPLEKCVVEGDQAGADVCRAALQQVPAPETPDIRLIFNPEGLSNTELEKLAELASAEALEKLHQALDAHEKKLADMQQHKTGRSALVGAQKKRIMFIQNLVATCEQHLREQNSS